MMRAPVAPALALALLIAPSLAVAGGAEAGSEVEQERDWLEAGDIYLLDESYEAAVNAYRQAPVYEGVLALPLLARAETFERWGKAREAARDYRLFLKASRMLNPDLNLQRLEARHTWLRWLDSSTHSKLRIRKGATYLISGVVLSGLGTLSYLVGRSKLEKAILNRGSVVSGALLASLGALSLSLGGILGLVGLGNLITAGILSSKYDREPPRPLPLASPPAWRRVEEGGPTAFDVAPTGNPEGLPPLSLPPIKILSE